MQKSTKTHHNVQRHTQKKNTSQQKKESCSTQTNSQQGFAPMKETFTIHRFNCTFHREPTNFHRAAPYNFQFVYAFHKFSGKEAVILASDQQSITSLRTKRQV